MILVKVGKNHHIKLPKEVIDNLNISVGDYLEMNEQASQIVIRLVKSGKAATEGREEFSGKGKWAQVAERLGKENLLGGEAGEALRKASREFRDNFRFREPPNFEHIEMTVKRYNDSIFEQLREIRSYFMLEDWTVT